VKIGDVYLVEIPTVGGHEQEGFRPAVIVQSEERVNELPTVNSPLDFKNKSKYLPFYFPDRTRSIK